MRLRVRGQRLEGRWKAALTARRLADGSDDVVSPDTGVAVLEDGRGGIARRSRKKGAPRVWSCSPGHAMSRLCLCLAGVLLAAGLAVLSTAPAHADPADGDLRLRGGASHNEGRLEGGFVELEPEHIRTCMACAHAEIASDRLSAVPVAQSRQFSKRLSCQYGANESCV